MTKQKTYDVVGKLEPCKLLDNLPWNNSGAAYGGLPQNVSNLFPGTNSLLKPKSAILMFISPSNNKFSAWKKRGYKRIKWTQMIQDLIYNSTIDQIIYSKNNNIHKMYHIINETK